MKKKLIALALTLVLLFNLAMPVFAGPTSGGGLAEPVSAPLHPSPPPICENMQDEDYCNEDYCNEDCDN